MILGQLFVAGHEGFTGRGEGGDSFHRLALGDCAGDRRQGQGRASTDHRLDERGRLGDGGIQRLFCGVQVAGNAGDHFSLIHVSLPLRSE